MTIPKKGKAKAAPAGKTARPQARDMTALVDLTPEEVKGLAKPRARFEEQVDGLLSLADTYSRDLGSSTIDPAEIRARLERWKELGPEEEAAARLAETSAKHHEMVTETRALQASTIWRAMMEIYGKAQASSNPGIKKGISAFGKFMATGPRAKPPAK